MGLRRGYAHQTHRAAGKVTPVESHEPEGLRSRGLGSEKYIPLTRKERIAEDEGNCRREEPARQ